MDSKLKSLIVWGIVIVYFVSPIDLMPGILVDDSLVALIAAVIEIVSRIRNGSPQSS